MGIVANTALPLSLSNVKSAYGKTGSWSLTDFRAGGSAGANSNTAAYDGWVPTTGNIQLSDLRDATNLNVTHTGSNTNYIVHDYDHQYYGGLSTAFPSITVNRDGRLQWGTIGNELGNTFTLNNNTWLMRTNTACTPETASLYEVLFVKTAGTGTLGFSSASNNTWNRCNTTRAIWTTASISDGFGTDNSLVKGRIKFRRADTQVELANVYFELLAVAQSTSGPPD